MQKKTNWKICVELLTFTLYAKSGCKLHFALFRLCCQSVPCAPLSNSHCWVVSILVFGFIYLLFLGAFPCCCCFLCFHLFLQAYRVVFSMELNVWRSTSNSIAMGCVGAGVSKWYSQSVLCFCFQYSQVYGAFCVCVHEWVPTSFIPGCAFKVNLCLLLNCLRTFVGWLNLPKHLNGLNINARNISIGFKLII